MFPATSIVAKVNRTNMSVRPPAGGASQHRSLREKQLHPCCCDNDLQQQLQQDRSDKLQQQQGHHRQQTTTPRRLSNNSSTGGRSNNNSSNNNNNNSHRRGGKVSRSTSPSTTTTTCNNKPTRCNYRSFVNHSYHDHAHDPEDFCDELPTMMMTTTMAMQVEDETALSNQKESLLHEQQHQQQQHLHHQQQQQQQQHQQQHVRGGPRGGVSTPFPEKLHEMLSKAECDSFDHIVSWHPHGRSFAVHQPKRFVLEIMPRFFKQSKLTSFQRQLNLYGFSRLTAGPDRGGYYHELFLRGRTHLCKRMMRTRVKGTGVKAAASPSTEPNFYDMEPCHENNITITASSIISMEDNSETAIPSLQPFPQTVPSSTEFQFMDGVVVGESFMDMWMEPPPSFCPTTVCSDEAVSSSSTDMSASSSNNSSSISRSESDNGFFDNSTSNFPLSSPLSNEIPQLVMSAPWSSSTPPPPPDHHQVSSSSSVVSDLEASSVAADFDKDQESSNSSSTSSSSSSSRCTSPMDSFLESSYDDLANVLLCQSGDEVVFEGQRFHYLDTDFFLKEDDDDEASMQLPTSSSSSLPPPPKVAYLDECCIPSFVEWQVDDTFGELYVAL